MNIDDKLLIHSFHQDSLDEVLDFCIQNPARPFYPRTLLKRFMTQLASSESLIFDIFDGPKRVAVSVLLDKVDNPSGSANLEIIGWNRAVGTTELFTCVFSNLPSGIPIQVATHESTNPSAEILYKFGFEFLYHTYDMKKPDVAVPKNREPNEVTFERLSLNSYDEFYNVLVKSFEANLETSIPPLEEMKETFVHQIKIKPSGTNLLILKGRIVGFNSVVQDESDSKNGEVHMIGILPEFRGRGLGAIALSKSISELKNLGCERCHLTVAAQNQSALNLYTKFGFGIEQKYTSYLRK